MQWLRRLRAELENVWKDLRKEEAFRRHVLQFVALVLMVPLATEPLFRLSELSWARVASRGWVVPIEPYLRVVVLVACFAAAAVVLIVLVGRVRSDVFARLQQNKTVKARAIDDGMLVVVALLLAEGALSEIVIKLAEQVPLAGAWQVALPVLVFAVFSGLVLFFAAITLRNVESLSRHRFENRIKEAKDRPASWPAKVVICALSVPAKSLTGNRTRGASAHRLSDYGRYAGATIASRFGLFADPEDTASAERKNPTNAAEFVELFNWRQIALAYDEQIAKPYQPVPLPRLILLCSSESRERIKDFQDFFEWLLEPVKANRPLFNPLERLKVWEKDVDFEDLKSITGELRAVYDAQCKEHGARKVIIDITGAQRPWTLAALEATLDTEERKHCVFSYVTQKPFKRDGKPSWVRYYDVDANREGGRRPDADAVGVS